MPPGKGHAGVLAADRRGEELDEAAHGVLGRRRAGTASELRSGDALAGKGMPVKTDRKDAHGIAQLMRLGSFRPVHCKPLLAQEVRALLTARKLLQTKNHDVETSLRGVLRGFGLRVGPTTPRTFVGRIRELVAGHGTLSTVAEARSRHAALFEQWLISWRAVRCHHHELAHMKLSRTVPPLY
jgi:hypothetical protein